MYGHKAAAIEGISANGLAWKSRINGVSDHSKRVAAMLEDDRPPLTEDDIAEIRNRMSSIAARFAARIPEDDLFGTIDDALEYLRHPGISVGDDLECTRDEWQEHMGALYDWADYNRVLIS